MMDYDKDTPGRIEEVTAEAVRERREVSGMSLDEAKAWLRRDEIRMWRDE